MRPTSMPFCFFYSSSPTISQRTYFRIEIRCLAVGDSLHNGNYIIYPSIAFQVKDPSLPPPCHNVVEEVKSSCDRLSFRSLTILLTSFLVCFPDRCIDFVRWYSLIFFLSSSQGSIASILGAFFHDSWDSEWRPTLPILAYISECQW